MRQVVSRLNVNSTPLLDFLDLAWVKGHGAKGGPLDSIGTKHATDNDLPLQFLGDLGKGRCNKSFVGVFHAPEAKSNMARFDADPKCEWTKAIGIDTMC